MRTRWPLYSALALGLAVFTVPALADGPEDMDQEVAVNDLPQVVRKAADEALRSARLKKAEWKKAYLKSETNRKVFEVEGTDGQDREVSVKVSDRGMVLKLEREVPESEVPENVKKALTAHMPDFRCEEVEANYGPDNRIQSYDFEGTEAGKPRKVVIDTGGKVLDVEKEGAKASPVRKPSGSNP